MGLLVDKGLSASRARSGLTQFKSARGGSATGALAREREKKNFFDLITMEFRVYIRSHYKRQSVFRILIVVKRGLTEVSCMKL